MRTTLVATLVVASLLGSTGGRQLDVAPCHLDRLPEQALCGTLQVFEDRSARAGRNIDIHVAVLPALRRATEPGPLFIMAGGPGQGARSYAALVARAFRDVRRSRDIVLVDLRGTGASHPLNCPQPDDEIAPLVRLFSGNVERDVAGCLRALGADPRHFTHANARADLDDVRQALGYEWINLWGGS